MSLIPCWVNGGQYATTLWRGEKAFQRLQEEIMRTSNDLSILACPDSSYAETSQLLAASPKAFRNCAKQKHLPLKEGYTFNNAGISLNIELEPCLLHTDGGAQYVAFLHSSNHQDCRTIFIRKYDYIFHRVVVADQATLKQRCQLVEGIPRRKQKILLARDEVLYSFDLDNQNFSTLICPQGVKLYIRSADDTPSPGDNWEPYGEGNLYHPGSYYFTVPSHFGILGYLTWTRHTERRRSIPYILCFGYGFDFQPIFLAFRSPIKHCRNPLALISHTTVMNRYIELMSETSTYQTHFDSSSGIHTAQGRRSEPNTIYLPRHSIRVQLGSSEYEPYNPTIALSLYQCSKDEPNLAEPSHDDIAELRKLFSTVAQRTEEEQLYDPFMADVPNSMSLRDLQHDETSFLSNGVWVTGNETSVLQGRADPTIPFSVDPQTGNGWEYALHRAHRV